MMDHSGDDSPVLGSPPPPPDEVWLRAMDHALDPWTVPDDSLVPEHPRSVEAADDLGGPSDHDGHTGAPDHHPDTDAEGAHEGGGGDDADGRGPGAHGGDAHGSDAHGPGAHGEGAHGDDAPGVETDVDVPGAPW